MNESTTDTKKKDDLLNDTFDASRNDDVVPPATFESKTTVDGEQTVVTETKGSEAVVLPPNDVAESSVQNSEILDTYPQGNVMRNYLITAGILVLMGAGVWYGLESQGRVQTNIFSGITQTLSGPAATVDGIAISRTEFERNLEQIIISAQIEGVDTTQEPLATEIRQQAIQSLVNTYLLKKAAADAGFSVSDEEVNERYDAVVQNSGGAEMLAERMRELKITESQLREDIAGELLIQSYLETVLDPSSTEVTEESILAVYEQVKSTNDSPDFPAYEVVRDQIAFELEAQARQQAIIAYIESLRADVDVVINI